jgi:RNA polymerase sigma-70 factor (ECF subfamily)
VSDEDERWEMLLPHRAAAVSAVLRATGSMADAEDCVHDAMLRVVRRADLDPGRVRSLLIRAALHLAIDHHRAALRQQQALVRLRGGADSDVVSPEQVHAERIEVHRLVAAINELPRRERQVLLLRLRGLTVLETAERLGLSYKSVEGAYTRARARVRLLVGSVLAWLVERLRRAASSRGEATATTVAALLLLGPGWGNGHRPAPQTGATALAPAAGGVIAPSEGPSRSPELPHRDRPGSVARAVIPPPAAQALTRRRPHDPRDDAIVGTPINVPGVLTTGIYITGPTDPSGITPVQDLQDCMARGGPWISLTYGPC